MSLSIASAGSPLVPLAAVGWLRGTAIPCVSAAADVVEAARDRALVELRGVSGTAYTAHAHSLLAHLRGLRERLVGAADLFESYADRLLAHEAVLDAVRVRAVAAGLPVHGDLVLGPVDPSDLRGSLVWSELASEVLTEHHELLAWVGSQLEARVPSYADPDLTAWVADFLDVNRVGLAASGLAGTASVGGSALTARGLLDSAGHLERLGRVPGPVATAVDTVVALESDEPAGALAVVAGGVGAAALAPLVVGGAPVVVVGLVGVGLGLAGAKAAEKAWGTLPEDVQDDLDEAVGEVWDDTKDLVADTGEDVLSGLEDAGDGLVAWAVR